MTFGFCAFLLTLPPDGLVDYRLLHSIDDRERCIHIGSAIHSELAQGQHVAIQSHQSYSHAGFAALVQCRESKQARKTCLTVPKSCRPFALRCCKSTLAITLL